MAAQDEALIREVEEKVALMRRLGVCELELSTGYARRLVLGPAPAGAITLPPPPLPEPPASPKLADPDEPKPADPEAKRKAKQEQRLFGAGK